MIASAIPYFWVGMMFILIFGLKLQWLPWSGGMNLTDSPAWTPSFIGDVVEHALLPGLALLITTVGTWTLTMRNNMVTTLADDYVRMARAKGLRPHRVMLNYAARNAILPNLTGFAMSLGFVVSGAILIEYVFNYPGVGYMLLQAVENEDYPADAGTLPADHGGGAGGGPAGRHRDRDLRPAHQEPAGDGARSGARSPAHPRPPPARSCSPPSSCSPSSPACSRRTARRPRRTRATSGRARAHLFGTTGLGQDIFAQAVYGTRQVLEIAFGAGLASTVIAALIGVAAAYLGGFWDGALNLFTDVVLVIPLFPLLIVIAAYVHNSAPSC